MVKKSAKKINKQDSSLLERQFGVVLEDINSKFDLVLEGHAALDTKIDKIHVELKREIGGLKGEVGGLKGEVGGLKGEIGGLKGDFYAFRAETKENFKTVFDYLLRIDEELKDIKVEITDIKVILENKADLRRLENLEKRIEKIEVELARQRK